PTDISTIFPKEDADPENESSYNFTTSDWYITGIIKAGCRVFYRLGESASNNETLRQPPKNFSKWAEICKHVVMHYNNGWANGYHYNITYWEIWNEPDLNGFWNGTAEQYYQLYNVTATTLKKYNPSLKIGGPCTSSVYNQNYTTLFLDYVKKNNIPLDFFSWHMYSSSPYELQKAAEYIDTLLNAYGFTGCENINTEWNINILTPQRDKDNAKNAAFTVSTIIAWQNTGLNHAFRYRGTQDNNWLTRLIGFDLSLFTSDGKYKTSALVYLAMKHITKETPLKLETLYFNISKGVAYLAGISKDKTNLSILVSNYNTKDKNFRINLSNTPWNGDYKMIHYVIDEKHHLEIVENTTLNKTDHTIFFNLKKNSVHLLWLTNSTRSPAEGPKIASIPLLLRIPLLDPVTKTLALLLLILIFG
ncbi:MAG TPA: hypothetical protein ENL13_00020, partial [Thermoplasmatales archaeon]|nr:hypothetical protein [Thermoplasmatales archaeon]